MENFSYKVGNSVLEFSYAEQFDYFCYLQEQMRQENELNAYISECMCLSEGASLKEYEMLHEAITDKISAGWNKAMDFIRRMWAKFTEAINNLVSYNNSYLKRYQDIILNRPIKFASRVQMNNCALGVDRMVKNQVKVIDAATLEAIPTDNDQDKMNKLRTRMIPAWHDGKNPEGGNADQNDFVGWLKNYFMATDKPLDTNPNGNEFNIRDMFNFCYEYNNGQLKKAIDNDNKAIDRTSKEFEDEIKKARTAAQNKNPKVIQQSDNDDNAKAASQNAKTDTQQPTQDVPKGGSLNANSRVTITGANSVKQTPKVGFNGESMVYPGLTIAGAIALHELKVVSGDNTAAGSGSAGGNDTSNTVGAAQRTATDNKKVDADEAKKAAGGADDEKTISTKANVYITLSGNIASAKWTACQFIYNEYMQFIRAHVQSYVGKEDQTAAAPAKQATDYNKTAGNPAPQQQQTNQESTDLTGDILNEGWGAALSWLFSPYGLGKPLIYDNISKSNFSKIETNPKFVKFINKLADKAVKEAKRDNKNLTEKIPDGIGHTKKDWDNSSFYDDLFRGTQKGNYERKSYKYEMFFLFDTDSLISAWVVLYDKERAKVVKVKVPAPSRKYADYLANS